jgi:flagellar basal-body rod modification protein FlgD
MITPISAVSPRDLVSSASSSSSASPTDPLAQEQTFLKLLVAQVRNQDPMAPNQDPTQYVTQLAQFSSLEQLTQMRADLDRLVSAVTSTTSATTSTQEQS